MWHSREGGGGGGGGGEGGGSNSNNRRSILGSIAVAIDRDKASKYALEWALQNLVSRDHVVKLVHVLQRLPSGSAPLFPDRSNSSSLEGRHLDGPVMDLVLPFRCYCLRRQVQCEVVVLEDLDVAKALVEFVTYSGIENLLLGTASRSSFSRLFKSTEIASVLLKSAPDFCNVFVIGKGKVIDTRPASRPVPVSSIEGAARPDAFDLSRSAASNDRMYDEISACENEMSAGRLSTDSNFLSFYENLGSPLGNEDSDFEDQSFGQELHTGSSHHIQGHGDSVRGSTVSHDNEGKHCHPTNAGIMEEDMRRLTVELQRTMDMYHAACKEAIKAKQNALELERSKMEVERKMRDIQLAERAAVVMAEKERAKSRAAHDAAERTQRSLEQEVQRRLAAEAKALKEAEDNGRALDAVANLHMALEYQSLFNILAALMILYFLYFFLGNFE